MEESDIESEGLDEFTCEDVEESNSDSEDWEDVENYEKQGDEEFEIITKEKDKVSEPASFGDFDMCSNCKSSPCQDGSMIVDTQDMDIGTKVAVPNCCKSYWGEGFRSQHGKVVKIDSLNMVTVHWVDGSESQYNLYRSQHPETDSVLSFNCRDEKKFSEEDIASENGREILDRENHSEDDICKNCLMDPCSDGKIISSTEQLPNKNCKVYVPNCSVDNWGASGKAQRGQVLKILSGLSVQVLWINGTESEYNVHDTDYPESDTVLCFNCDF